MRLKSRHPSSGQMQISSQLCKVVESCAPSCVLVVSTFRYISKCCVTADDCVGTVQTSSLLIGLRSRKVNVYVA